MTIYTLLDGLELGQLELAPPSPINTEFQCMLSNGKIMNRDHIYRPEKQRDIEPRDSTTSQQYAASQHSANTSASVVRGLWPHQIVTNVKVVPKISSRQKEAFVGGQLSEGVSRMALNKRKDEMVTNLASSRTRYDYALTQPPLQHLISRSTCTTASVQKSKAPSVLSHIEPRLQSKSPLPSQSQTPKIYPPSSTKGKQDEKKKPKEKVDMSVLQNRVKTFNEYQPHWPKMCISFMILASQGLYFSGIEDICKCFECKVLIEDWKAFDNPLERHFILSPNCPFLRKEFLDEIHSICTRIFSSFATLESRINSFASWPIPLQVSRVSLAAAGWFYKGKDIITQCFSCGCEYDDWKKGDDPIKVHQDKCQGCYFLNSSRPSGGLQVSGALSSSHLDYSSMVNRLSSFSNVIPKILFISEEEFADAGFFFAASSPKFTVQCYSCHLVISDWLPRDDPCIKHMKMQPDCLFLNNKRRTIPVYDKGKESYDTAETGKQFPASIPLSSATFNADESSVCSVCLTNRKEYAIVPCGHFCVCGDCSDMLLQCPLCRSPMRSVLKIYDS